MRRRLGARPAQLHVLANYQLKSADQRSFHRGDVDLAIALSGVSVTGEKQRAFRMHGNEKRRARNQFLVVQVAGMDPRRPAADASRNIRGATPMLPKNG